MPLWIFETETLQTMLADTIRIHSAPFNRHNQTIRAETLSVIREIESELTARSQTLQPYEE